MLLTGLCGLDEIETVLGIAVKASAVQKWRKEGREHGPSDLRKIFHVLQCERPIHCAGASRLLMLPIFCHNVISHHNARLLFTGTDHGGDRPAICDAVANSPPQQPQLQRFPFRQRERDRQQQRQLPPPGTGPGGDLGQRIGLPNLPGRCLL